MVIHLFTGIINGVENYVDDPMEVLHRKLTSLSGFWFDFVTSLPWSYLDYNALLVCIAFSAAKSYSITFGDIQKLFLP